MKKSILTVVGAIAMTVAGVGVGAAISGAEAQSAGKAPVILIVDRAQLISQSKAGKTIPNQAETVKKNVEKELEAEAEKLKTDIEKYQKNRELLAEEVRQKTEQELAIRQQYGLPQRAQIMEQAFVAAIQNAETKILLESRPILKEIVDKRAATVLLDRSAVMYAAPETDITQEVIAALDKKMSTVEVQKISLADIEKKLKEAQEANKGKK